MLQIQVPRQDYVKNIERYYREGIIDGGQQFDPDIYNHMIDQGLAPRFSAAAPEVMQAPIQTTFLWRYLTIALRDYYKNQSYKFVPQYQAWGTCVGQCAKLGGDMVCAINSILYRRAFVGRIAVAGTYTISRVEIGQSPGSWQGSSCGWAAKGMQSVGMLLLKSLNLNDEQSEYGGQDEQIAMKWTRNRDGVPSEYEKLAHDRSIVTTPAISNITEAAAAISNGSPLIIGCTLIPNGRRGTKGISAVASSRQGHATLIDGVLVEGGKIIAFHYQNSWSASWASGTVFPDDMPDGSCWIAADEFAAMVSQRDCYALVDVNGLLPRTPASGSSRLVAI